MLPSDILELWSKRRPVYAIGIIILLFDPLVKFLVRKEGEIALSEAYYRFHVHDQRDGSGEADSSKHASCQPKNTEEGM